MSNAEFISKLLASAVVRGKSAKEAAGNMLKKEAATFQSAANLINKKGENKMTELVEEVREMKQLVNVGFNKVIKAKEAELKILKEKECRSWFRMFW